MSHDKPVSKHVPIIRSVGSFGTLTITIEHVDGSKRYFIGEEGDHASAEQYAQEYYNRNSLDKNKLRDAELLVAEMGKKG